MLGYEWILLAIGTAGFGLGAYWDIKTTEFPDWLPYSIILSALGVRGAFAYILGDWWILLSSVIVGALFLGFGLMLYFMKQWGDGDAWLLGGLGFLFPAYSAFEIAANPFQFWGQFPFPIIMLFNFFFISFAYLVAYSIGLGLRYRKVSRKFWKELRSDSRNVLLLMIFFAAACLAMILYLGIYLEIPLSRMYNMLSLPFLFAAVIIFIRYGRFVEQNLFRKKVLAKNLRVGDVLIGEKWKGLTQEEIKKLRKKGGSVWIKEGVRFAPVFIIALYVTLFLGSLLGIFV
ncbi:MAG TPA: HMG-box domain-containing protein [archaeon]|nr:HMG-box domain-containing protein [archaeon]